MKSPTTFAAMLLATVLATAGSAAAAQDKLSSAPIRVINPYAVGGVVDVLARILTDKLAGSLGATFIVEAKPGGAGNIGTDFVAQSPADGHTWLIATTSNAANMALMPNIRTDILRDLVPVAQFATSPNYFVVPAGSPAASLGEYVAMAKTQPGKLSYGSAGNGSTPHLGFELLKYSTGIDVAAIPYKGAPPIITDLASGQLSATLMPASLAISQSKTGKFKLLAVANDTRTKDFPDVPTMAEAGYGKAVVAPWFAVLVPKGTPAAVVSRVETAIKLAVEAPEVAARIEAAGAVPIFKGGAQTLKMLESEVARWRDVVRATGLSAQ